MKQNAPAFTLIEMLISITIFTVFIGFAMGTYLVFHRAQAEAAVMRKLLVETNQLFETITGDVHDLRLDYAAYGTPLSATTGPLKSNALYLMTPDGEEHWALEWDSENKELIQRKVNATGLTLPGYTEPKLMHSAAVDVEEFSLEIFPYTDPASDPQVSTIQYQPMVRVLLKTSTPGRVREILEVDLQTTVTSRYY